MTAPSIPNIDIGDPIGSGSFGNVFRGRHRTLNVDVAVKLIGSGVVPDLDAVLQEARLMARLDHPNLLRIFDAGGTDAGLYFVLELMDGTCVDMRAIDAQRATDLLLQLLAGLQALHDARILHRDIKPANCLVRARDGRVKLADLGLSVEQTTATRHRFELAGTLPFMAPELFDNPPKFSPSSDLYALGLTMQCLLLERPPYPIGQLPEVIAWIHGGERPRMSDSRRDLAPAVAQLIDRMTARAVADRPAGAADALAALTRGTTRSLALATDVATDATIRIIGSWVLGREIPHDGNFREYAVTHRTTGAAGRLKHLKPNRPLSGASRLILASAERASRLSHHGIADLVDWGMHDDFAYVVTRAQGQTLETIVKTSGPLDEVEALQATRDVADALAYLHAAGLVYQVVNPGFALVGGDARSVKLSWPMFCVPAGSPIRTADSPLLISVPLFAAPESLVRPERRPARTEEPVVEIRIDERVDLYGLGEILFFLIAGRPAFSDTPELPGVIFAKLRRSADLRAAVPFVSALTAQLVGELTDPDPSARPQTAVAVRDRLDSILARLRP
jgi:serine/threonine protein kinase